MTLSNFTPTGTRNDGHADFATVDVTTGFLWWKTVRRRSISKVHSPFWFFTDTGKFTPGYQAERLEMACHARACMKHLL